MSVSTISLTPASYRQTAPTAPACTEPRSSTTQELGSSLFLTTTLTLAGGVIGAVLGVTAGANVKQWAGIGALAAGLMGAGVSLMSWDS